MVVMINSLFKFFLNLKKIILNDNTGLIWNIHEQKIPIGMVGRLCELVNTCKANKLLILLLDFSSDWFDFVWIFYSKL